MRTCVVNGEGDLRLKISEFRWRTTSVDTDNATYKSAIYNLQLLDRCGYLNGGIPLRNAIMQRGEPSIELRDL